MSTPTTPAPIAEGFATYTEIHLETAEAQRFLVLSGKRERAARNLGNTESEDRHAALWQAIKSALEIQGDRGTARAIAWYTDEEVATLKALGWVDRAPVETPIPPRPAAG